MANVCPRCMQRLTQGSVQPRWPSCTTIPYPPRAPSPGTAAHRDAQRGLRRRARRRQPAALALQLPQVLRRPEDTAAVGLTFAPVRLTTAAHRHRPGLRLRICRPWALRALRLTIVAVVRTAIALPPQRLRNATNRAHM
jgi:hypothetical protein